MSRVSSRVVLSLSCLAASTMLSACWILAGTEGFEDAPVGGGTPGEGGGGAEPCVGSACQAQGESCEAPTDCATGFCADGVCCESACDGTCLSCATNGQLGLCLEAPVGPAEAGECEGFAMCDGAGHCAEGVYELGRMFGGNNHQRAFGIAPATRGFALAGTTDTAAQAWSLDNVINVGVTPGFNNDWFLARFNSSAMPQAGGNLGSNPIADPLGVHDELVDVAVDDNGDAYFVGWINAQLSFNGTTVGFSNSQADRDAVLAKFTESGAPVWAHHRGSAGNEDRGYAVAIAADGSIVWGGSQSMGMFVDVVTPQAPNGNQRLFGALGDVVHDIAIGPSGEMAIAGVAMNPVTFDTGIAVTPNTNAGQGAPFVAVFQSPSGAALWAKGLEGNAIYGTALAVTFDSQGRVYVGGSVQGAAGDFGAGLEELPAGDQTHGVGYVLAYEADGTYRWHHTLARAIGDGVRSLAVDAWDNVLAVGQLSGDVTIDDVTLQPGDAGALALKLSPNGTAIWGRVFGDSGQQSFEDAAFDGTNFLLCGGWTGPFPIAGGGETPPFGLTDMFVMALSP